MNREETIHLCRYVKACCPQQAIDEYTPDAWHDLLGDLSADDCLAAVRSLVRRQPFAAPAEIRTEVARIRSARLEGFQYVPVAGDEHTAVYLANLRAQRAAVADGYRPAAPPALPASEPQAEAVRDLVAGVFPEPPATDEPPARHAAETTAETRRRKAVEAYGYLLMIDSDAARTATASARERLGPGADQDEVAILAATLTDATPQPPAKPDKATADLLAAQGCPNGCPLGEHVKPCFYVVAS